MPGLGSHSKSPPAAFGDPRRLGCRQPTGGPRASRPGPGPGHAGPGGRAPTARRPPALAEGSYLRVGPQRSPECSRRRGDAIHASTLPHPLWARLATLFATGRAASCRDRWGDPRPGRRVGSPALSAPRGRPRARGATEAWTRHHLGLGYGLVPVHHDAGHVRPSAATIDHRSTRTGPTSASCRSGTTFLRSSDLGADSYASAARTADPARGGPGPAPECSISDPPGP